MDFIKTSSLRALIELTFQRNWNGFIWMSRKGVIAKRVKAAPDGYIENQRPNAQSGWPRNMFRARPNRIRPTEVSAKVQPPADHATRPGKHCPAVGQAKRFTPRRARPAREPGNKASRPRNPFAYHGRCIRPSRERTSHVRPRNHRPNLRPPDQPADHETIRPDRSDSAKTRLSGRSSRPTVRTPRSTRSRF
ncbi:unnamed protein product [Microthlaspi erraticum]|uniref:Uncharacterized protein n=1 Tax=Microthlaspi erraticum TaxID=1685480 RepID=A0A6D2HZW1_9BRAS|nr:unnamed protein product [Microthlaspi erraticum]